MYNTLDSNGKLDLPPGSQVLVCCDDSYCIPSGVYTL